MSSSKVKHAQSENDKMKPISEKVSFGALEKLIIKKEEGVWFSLLK